MFMLGKGDRLDTMAGTGVSLHCHTLHSREMLDFVPYYAKRIPIASYFWNRQMTRHERLYGSRPDFGSGHWTPPLTGGEVFDSEAESIGALGLDSIVSITDHDSIGAGVELQLSVGNASAPISFEWTVPYDEGFFHLGIHNLPPDEAESISSRLLAYTHSEFTAGSRDHLRELFKMLNEYQDVLIVLNHPIWDIEMIGQAAHERLLARFLDDFSEWMHAVEINGFRSWKENQGAAALAELLGLPLVSGGDRHCLQPNTMINITDAGSFAEFAHEIRYDAFSRIVVRPEYHRPLPCRQLDSIKQILGSYDHFPKGRQTWPERVYLDYKDGKGLRSLSESWEGGTPAWMSPAFFVLRLLTVPAAQFLIGYIFGDNDIGRDDRRPEEENPRQAAANSQGIHQGLGAHSVQRLNR